MNARIDSIYCFDYTKNVAHCDSIRDFGLEEMAYIGFDLPTPKIQDCSSPVSFVISNIESNQIREYVVSQFSNLNEIKKDIAINSPRYILIRFFDGNERYYTYNDRFYTAFKAASQNKSQERQNTSTDSPLQQKESQTDARDSRLQMPTSQVKPFPQRNNDSYHSDGKGKSFSRVTLWSCVLIVGALLCSIISGIINDTKPLSTEKTNSSTNIVDPDANLTPVYEPKSGTILSGKEVQNGSEITIHASKNHACVVKLKSRYKIDRMSFYVRAGETVTVSVPAERLFVYFASGDTWYGKKNLFGSKTKYTKDDEIFDFSKYTCEYTLYSVDNGNFTETTISADEFN